MFDKDKPYWKAKEDRNLRLSEGMDKAIAEYRYKKENNIPIDKPLSASTNEDYDTLPRLPNKLAARKKKTNTRSRR